MCTDPWKRTTLLSSDLFSSFDRVTGTMLLYIFLFVVYTIVSSMIEPGMHFHVSSIEYSAVLRLEMFL